MKKISICIPLLNEAESLPELTSWINKVLDENSLEGEIIFIDDGGTDESWEVINQLQSQYENVRGISFARNYGKAPDFKRLLLQLPET